MPLISRSRIGDAIKSAIVLDLGDLMRQGERIKAAARAEADRLIAEGREERRRLIEGAAEEGRREGWARGIEEGRAAGAAEGRDAALAETRERLAALESAWTAALADFQSRREELLTAARADIVRLAATVAQIVTRRAVALDGSAAEAQLSAILSLLAAPTKLAIRVHPGDAAAFRAALPALAARFDSAGHAQLIEDASLAQGSCVATTPGGGEIDASIEAQLERIAEALLPGTPPRGPAGTRTRR